MFTGKPQIKLHALLVWLLGSVLAWGTVVRECLVAAWQARLRGGCSGCVESWNYSPVLQRFSFKKKWESLPFGNQWKLSPYSLIMAFLKTARKMKKIEAVGRKEWKEQGDLRVTVRAGMHLWRGTVDGTMETNCTSEQHPKESSMPLSERFQQSSVSIFQGQMNLFVKKTPISEKKSRIYVKMAECIMPVPSFLRYLESSFSSTQQASTILHLQ